MGTSVVPLHSAVNELVVAPTLQLTRKRIGRPHDQVPCVRIALDVDVGAHGARQEVDVLDHLTHESLGQTKHVGDHAAVPQAHTPVRPVPTTLRVDLEADLLEPVLSTRRHDTLLVTRQNYIAIVRFTRASNL